MNVAPDRSPAALPVACTLSAGDGAERMRRWEALARAGHATLERDGHRLTVAYRAAPGVGDELEALAAAERRCCAFVSWTVSHEPDRLVLTVAADPARPAEIDAVTPLFAV